MTTENIPEINIEVKSGTHKRGDDYPAIDFSLIQKYRVTNDAGVICTSQDQVNKQIDEMLIKFPNQGEVKYFYYVIKSVKNIQEFV